MTRRQLLGVVSGHLFVWLFASAGVAQRLNHNSYLGKQPPEIKSQSDHWLGWHKKVALANLKGKVVWLQFNFGEDCVSLRPDLISWQEKYADAGLVVIEVNRSIGEPLQAMRWIVESQGLKHPVLWDAECRNTKAYGITAWPFAYLIDANGKVFWEGNPSRWIRSKQKVVQMRANIEKELRKALPATQNGLPSGRSGEPAQHASTAPN